MTQDEIIDMARQAGFTVGYGSPALPKHEAFAKLVAAKEREACAKVCDQLESGKYEDGFPAAGMAWECANAIRARGEA
jgi:hypothetical protein